MNNRWSGGVGPEAGEPRAFAAGQGKHQSVLTGALVPGGADGEDQAVQGGKRVLDSGAQYSLAKQAHQVVREHGKPNAASVAQKSRRLKASRPKSAFSSLIRFSQSARPR